MANSIMFKGWNVYLDHDPRRGVCNRCRYAVGEVHSITGKIYRKTYMHHEVYDPTDVLAHTIQLCGPCHRQTRRNRPPKKPKRDRFIKLTKETYHGLMELGRMQDDFEDVISRLIRYHRERQ